MLARARWLWRAWRRRGWRPLRPLICEFYQVARCASDQWKKRPTSMPGAATTDAPAKSDAKTHAATARTISRSCACGEVRQRCGRDTTET